MNSYFYFNDRLVLWRDANAENERKFTRLKKRVGEIFIRNTRGGQERSQELRDHLYKVTGFKIQQGEFSETLSSLSKGNRASPELATALYLLCRLDPNLNAHVKVLDKILFGGKNLEDAVGWSPPESRKQSDEDVLKLKSKSFPDFQLLDSHESVQFAIQKLCSTFVGRIDELRKLDKFFNERMADDNRGLLILSAPAGYGKSALAAAWCHQNTQVRDRFLAVHFCRPDDQLTTNVDKALDYLRAQVCYAYSVEPTHTNPVGQVKWLLSQDMPQGRQLIVWLDGIDQCETNFPWFLPKKLGKSVFVGISVCNLYRDVPPYLAEVMDNADERDYATRRLHLMEFPAHTVDELVASTFSKNIADIPSGIGYKIWDLSARGHPSLAVECVQRLAEIAKGKNGFSKINKNINHSLLNSYIQRIAENIKINSQWNEFRHLFALLCIVKRPLCLDEVNDFLPPEKRIASFNLIPSRIRRLISITATQSGYFSDLSTPELKPFLVPHFEEEISPIISQICRPVFATNSVSRQYRLDKAPFHILDSKGPVSAIAFLLGPYSNMRRSLFSYRDYLKAQFDDLEYILNNFDLDEMGNRRMQYDSDDLSRAFTLLNSFWMEAGTEIGFDLIPKLMAKVSAFSAR